MIQTTTRVSPLLAVMLLFFLIPATIAADDALESANNEASTEAVTTVTTDDGDDIYVVHDEVFVEETVPEVPSSSTVAAKLPLPLEETPLTVDFVAAETLAAHDAQVLGDALERVPGINVQSGNGLFDFFTIRGLDSSSNGIILTDGAREPQSAFFQLYNIERVEVLRGPSSFLYGGASMGGAVNLVRKQPHRGRFANFSLSGGSYETWQGTLDANHYESDNWGVRVNAQWWQSDLHRDDKKAENFAVNPAFTFKAGDKTSIHVNLEFIDTDARPDAGLPLVFNFFDLTAPPTVADVPAKRSYDTPFSRSEQEVYRFQIDVETRFTDNFVLRNKTFVRTFDWLSDSTSLDGVGPTDPFNPFAGLSVFRTQLALDNEQTFTGNQLEALWRVGNGTVRHNLLFGLELAELEDEFTFSIGAVTPIDLFQPVETAQGVLFPLFGFGTDAKSTVVSPYVIDQIHFSDKFQLLLGVRFDDIDFEDDLTGIRRDDSEASPMVGAVYSPTSSFSVYANAGAAFTPQSTFVVGENREPEESDQVELGFRFGRRDGKFQGTFAIYRLDRENVAIPDQTGITRQTGSQRNDGVELELRGELRPGLTASFQYALTEAELTEFSEQVFVPDPATGQFFPITLDLSGNTAAWVPENIASLWLAQDFDRWGVAVGGRWVDEQFISEDNAFAIDDYFLVDASLWFGKAPWRFQINLDNITDEDYFTRVFAGNSVIPAAGFTARGGIRYGF